MQRFLLRGILTISAMSLIVSCGGGGGSNSTTSTLQGQFVDAPVTGLEYSTSSGISGVTDENGYFSYKKGDTVTFKVGKIVLGDTKADKVVTPSTLFADENLDKTKIQEKVQQIVALLLALDGNPNDDKIEIPDHVRENLDKLNTEIDLEKEDLTNKNVQIDLDGDGKEEDLSQEVQNKEQEAKEHYSASLYSLVKEALQNLNGKKFHIEKHKGDSVTADCDTCTLSYNGGDSFSFNCESGDTDSPSIVKDTTTGDVYIVEGNGKKDLVISASDDKLCLIPYDAQPGEYLCIVEGKSPNPNGCNNNGNISYTPPTLQDFENFLTSLGSNILFIYEGGPKNASISVNPSNNTFEVVGIGNFVYGSLSNGLPYVKEINDTTENPVPYVDSNVACIDESGIMSACIVKYPFYSNNSSDVQSSILGMWKRYKFQNNNNNYQMEVVDSGSCMEFKNNNDLTYYDKRGGNTYYLNYNITNGVVNVDTGNEKINLFVLEKINNNRLFVFAIWKDNNGNITDSDFRIWEKVQTCD